MIYPMLIFNGQFHALEIELVSQLLWTLMMFNTLEKMLNYFSLLKHVASIMLINKDTYK